LIFGKQIFLKPRPAIQLIGIYQCLNSKQNTKTGSQQSEIFEFFRHAMHLSSIYLIVAKVKKFNGLLVQK
jgi:hypothetical protein